MFRGLGDRLVERPPDRPAEGAIGDRQHGAVRAELPDRLRQGLLQLGQVVPVHGGDRLCWRSGERLLGGHLVVTVDDRDDYRGARLELVADSVLDAAVHPVPGERADQAAGGRADSDGRE
jgi:hypothetical protein